MFVAPFDAIFSDLSAERQAALATPLLPEFAVTLAEVFASPI